jgi:2-polyprenyl-3-methyl-5-hydroxy-6-metoxy-1,4-benzoquinol methylase
MVDWTEPCLACGGVLACEIAQLHDTRFGIPQPYGIGRCRHCDLLQTVPRPSAAELERLYAKHYNFGGESGTLYTRLRQRFLASSLYRLWLALDGDISFHARPGRGALLDIGCNEGRGLPLYAANGFAIVDGLETNPVAAAAARQKGFAVHELPPAQFRPAQPYDVVVLSNVLEHALDPAAMLREVARLLKPGGAVWISCPNARSWLAELFGTSWINWHVPFHICHFSPATLAATLARAGFTVERSEQATPALWVAHTLIAAAAAQPGRPTRLLRQPILVMALMAISRGLLFPALWLGNRLGRGDCLMITARAPQG